MLAIGVLLAIAQVGDAPSAQPAPCWFAGPSCRVSSWAYHFLFLLLSPLNVLSAVSPQTSAHGRQLQTTVSDVAGLSAALADPSIGHIILAAGTYSLTSQLSISRDVTVEAAQTGAAVLDGQDSTRVLLISSGTVELIGLHIARGSADYVRAPGICPSPPWTNAG